MAKKTKLKTTRSAAGLFIPAGLFVGLGVGFIMSNILAGLFIGLGVGFLAFAIAKIFKE